MSGINPNYKGCVFCGQEECNCPYTGKERPEEDNNMADWIPVNDITPKPEIGSTVLALLHSDNMLIGGMTVAWWDGMDWESEFSQQLQVTHWQTLPRHPEPEPPPKRLCQEHAAQYLADYEEEATVVEESDCQYCTRHQSGCICADCSGAELTSDND